MWGSRGSRRSIARRIPTLCAGEPAAELAKERIMERGVEMELHGTTVIAVSKNSEVAMAGDGQVTLGNTIMKGNAKKVRKIYDGKVLVGFAGARPTPSPCSNGMRGS
jgi:hypothetical protein